MVQRIVVNRYYHEAETEVRVVAQGDEAKYSTEFCSKDASDGVGHWYGNTNSRCPATKGTIDVFVIE